MTKGVRLNSRIELSKHEGNKGQRCLLVNNVITIDKQFYFGTKEVIKSSRVTHFKTNFY